MVLIHRAFAHAIWRANSQNLDLASLGFLRRSRKRLGRRNHNFGDMADHRIDRALNWTVKLFADPLHDNRRASLALDRLLDFRTVEI